jgi:hypothetical protein
MLGQTQHLVILFVLTIMLLFAVPLSGDFPLKQHVELRRQSSFNKQLDSYFIGVGRGIFWANTVLEVTGQQPLFCTPEKLTLDDGIILSLIHQEVRSRSKDPNFANTPVELLAVKAFQIRFPCK